jgi:hypothetical protein
MMKLHIQTYLTEEPDGWVVNVDIGRIVSESENATAEEIQGFQVGPFESRERAFKEVTGPVRTIVLERTRKALKENGGYFEHFELNETGGSDG